jgi:hypothetical protein
MTGLVGTRTLFLIICRPAFVVVEVKEQAFWGFLQRSTGMWMRKKTR